MGSDNRVKEVDGQTARKGRKIRFIVAGAALVVIALVGGPWVYINLIKDDAPDKLTVDALDTLVADSGATDSASAAADTSSADSAAADATNAAVAAGAASDDLTGSWSVTQPSTAGYRVTEILFGQSTEGVGRTTDVTGSVTISGNSLTDGNISVDLTTLKSDENRRDGQVQNRLLETATNPTAEFTVRGPVALPTPPAVDGTVTVDVPGTLNLHGVEKDVTISLTVKRTAAGFQVAGSIDLLFADYGIPDPSNVAAKTADHGLLELAMTFLKA